MASLGQDFWKCGADCMPKKVELQLMAGLGRNVCRRRHRPNA